MILLSENIYLFTVILLFLISIICIYFFVNYKRLKTEESNRLRFILSEVEEEKKVAQQLHHVPQHVKAMQQKTQLKINSINVQLLDIKFTLDEIF